ncbi:hypothetical protein D9758_006806 [Tetrapyrgos nigripes]|uniref:Uncharacterized protein n=1 Tax=Tetrapyrgos nigripes TaxID=182062 RepID=A0A8H5CW47_9AGAR|nr:hypothetical protein D9758_006806 [Tetrapyrgos nigripes]
MVSWNAVNGNGHTFDGAGPSYWDGQGGNGGVTKPAPMMKISISGVYKDVKVLNSPARTYSVSNPAPLTMTNLIIDNSASITRTIVSPSTEVLTSLSPGTPALEDMEFLSDQALRIKTKSDATSASVSDVTYSGNTATGMKRFGVIIDQVMLAQLPLDLHQATIGTPGNGVTLSGVNFVDAQTTISVNSGAQRVAVNCGVGSCTGSWDWSKLKVTGGSAGKITNFSGIKGFSQ